MEIIFIKNNIKTEFHIIRYTSINEYNVLCEIIRYWNDQLKLAYVDNQIASCCRLKGSDIKDTVSFIVNNTSLTYQQIEDLKNEFKFDNNIELKRE